MAKIPKFYGIDVGKSTTKIIVADLTAKTIKIEEAFSFQTGNSSLTSDDQLQRQELAQRIKESVNGAKLDTRKAVVALPEPAIFNRLLTLPDMPEDQLKQALHWNAQQYLPIPIEEVQLDTIKVADIEQDGNKMQQLLLVAAPKKLVQHALDVFNKADQELIAVETEAVATTRIIANAYPDQPALLIMDIGSSGTDLSVVVNNKLIFSQSLGTGFFALNNAISKSFSIDENQSKQYLTKFGLLPNEGEGKIYKALEPVSNIILSEISKTINFFKSKYPQNTPQKILIVGEGATVPGIAEYFAGKLGINTELANLTANLEISSEAGSVLNSTEVYSYAVALGLAIKTH